ncbi:MAG: heme exporter protein CcmB [Eggerthellaceae bacterium]|nr:heme exporter protein CcmB [Eggerthellaceae bacterium]
MGKTSKDTEKRDSGATDGAIGRPSGFSQYFTLLKKDFEQEFHTWELLTSMGIYAILVLVVYGAAFAFLSSDIDIASISGGLIWVLILFTSLLGLNRSFSHELASGALEGLLLAPLDRSVIFLAKATSNFVFLLIVEVIAIPVFFFFFLSDAGFETSAWLIIIPVIIGTIGIAGIGTLLSTRTINPRGREVRLAVLFKPLSVPLMYACVSATTSAIVGGDGMWEAFVPAIILGAAYDVIMLILSWLLYDAVVSG